MPSCAQPIHGVTRARKNKRIIAPVELRPLAFECLEVVKRNKEFHADWFRLLPKLYKTLSPGM